jgi:hypothetical protein
MVIMVVLRFHNHGSQKKSNKQSCVYNHGSQKSRKQTPKLAQKLPIISQVLNGFWQNQGGDSWLLNLLPKNQNLKYLKSRNWQFFKTSSNHTTLVEYIANKCV